MKKKDIPVLCEVLGEKFSSWNDVFVQLGVVDCVESFSLADKDDVDAVSVAQNRSEIIHSFANV